MENNQVSLTQQLPKIGSADRSRDCIRTAAFHAHNRTTEMVYIESNFECSKTLPRNAGELTDKTKIRSKNRREISSGGNYRSKVRFERSSIANYRANFRAE